MNLTINVSDDLYRRAAEAAVKIPVEGLFASALEKRVWEKVSCRSYEKSRRVMSVVPAVEPPKHDRL